MLGLARAALIAENIFLSAKNEKMSIFINGFLVEALDLSLWQCVSVFGSMAIKFAWCCEIQRRDGL